MFNIEWNDFIEEVDQVADEFEGMIAEDQPQDNALEMLE